jgi:hypothetical protein
LDRRLPILSLLEFLEWGKEQLGLRYFLHHVMVRKEINDMAYS